MSARGPAGGRRLLLRTAVLVLLAVSATGCTRDQWSRFGSPEPITVQGVRVLRLWRGASIAAVVIGLAVLALIFFCAFYYRKRNDDLPSQVHYNLPIEMIYTIVPGIIILVLFYFTAIDETYVNKLSKKPDLVVNIVGFQWSWQFNYADQDLSITGRPGVPPQMVIPTDRTIQFVLTSPDVIHDPWVPEFLFKRDDIPGRKNKFEVTVTKEGVYTGRCAEYCGVYHSRMLFSVKVVSPQAFDQFIRSAKSAAATGNSPIYTSTSGSFRQRLGATSGTTANAAGTSRAITSTGRLAAATTSGSTK